MSSGPILELRDLSVLLGGSRRWFGKSVPPTVAVNGVSLSISAGEVLALVGESGCGKTTLGRTVLGLQRETSGDILLDGRAVGGLAPRRGPPRAQRDPVCASGCRRRAGSMVEHRRAPCGKAC